MTVEWYGLVLIALVAFVVGLFAGSRMVGNNIGRVLQAIVKDKDVCSMIARIEAKESARPALPRGGSGTTTQPNRVSVSFPN